MLSLKEILILTFTVISCLAIFLYVHNQPAVKYDTVDYPKTEAQSYSPAEIGNQSIWTKSETKDRPNSQLENLSQEGKEEKDETGIETRAISLMTPSEEKPSARVALSETDNFNTRTMPSLEDILAEAKNLSLKLKLEFEEYQSENCASCGQAEKEEQKKQLNDYALSIGYSSWEEYFYSEQYRLAEQEFFANKDQFLKENPPDSICAIIFAQAGGGGGGGGTACDCDNAMGTCYQDTSSGRYYHCIGLCCCACCFMCCLI